MSRNSTAARDISISTPQLNSPSIPTSDVTSASKRPGKPKGKRKKKVDITAFVQTDLQDFKQKQAQTQRQAPAAVVRIKEEPETEQMPPDVKAEHGRGAAGDTMATVQSFEGQQPMQSPQGDASQSLSSTLTETAPIPSVPVALAIPNVDSSPSFAPPYAQDVKQPVSQTEEPPAQVIRSIPENSRLGQLFKYYEEYTAVEDLSLQDTELPGQREEKEAIDNAGLAEDIATLDCAAKDSDGVFHVIALSPGHAGETNVTFTLDITESTMGAISNWVNRSALRLR